MKLNSIVTTESDKCFVCGTTQGLELHHIFFGSANRKISDKYGLTVMLCNQCHRGTSGVHHNRKLDLHIKQLAQIEFEKNFSFEEFMKLIGKNYR